MARPHSPRQKSLCGVSPVNQYSGCALAPVRGGRGPGAAGFTIPLYPPPLVASEKIKRRRYADWSSVTICIRVREKNAESCQNCARLTGARYRLIFSRCPRPLSQETQLLWNPRNCVVNRSVKLSQKSCCAV